MKNQYRRHGANVNILTSIVEASLVEALHLGKTVSAVSSCLLNAVIIYEDVCLHVGVQGVQPKYILNNCTVTIYEHNYNNCTVNGDDEDAAEKERQHLQFQQHQQQHHQQQGETMTQDNYVAVTRRDRLLSDDHSLPNRPLPLPPLRT